MAKTTLKEMKVGSIDFEIARKEEMIKQAQSNIEKWQIDISLLKASKTIKE